MKESKIVAQMRSEAGSAAARRLRNSGWLPGVLYGDGGENRSIKINAHAFKMLLRHHTGENLLLDMELDGAAGRKVFLKEVQHDPLTGDATHADFLAVSMTRKMRVRIPLVLVGDAVGVVTEGGILEQILRELEVECLPGDLVETIEVDVSGLHINTHMLVRDLKVDAKLTVLTDGHVAVAGVMEPQKEAEPAAEGAAPAEGAAAAGPEVISEKAAEDRQKAKEGEKAEGGKKPAEGAKKEEKKPAK